MKTQRVILYAVLLILIGTCAYSQSFNLWSPVKTASGVILAQPAYLLGIIITPDGTTACKVDLYNNASAAAGNYVTYTIGAGAADSSGFIDNSGGYFNQGIYANLTTTGTCSFNVKYR